MSGFQRRKCAALKLNINECGPKCLSIIPEWMETSNRNRWSLEDGFWIGVLLSPPKQMFCPFLAWIRSRVVLLPLRTTNRLTRLCLSMLYSYSRNLSAGCNVSFTLMHSLGVTDSSGTTPVTQRTWIEFLASGFGMAKPWLLWALAERTRDGVISDLGLKFVKTF